MQMLAHRIEEARFDVVERVTLDHARGARYRVHRRNDFNPGLLKNIADLHFFDQLVAESDVEGCDLVLDGNVGVGLIDKLSD